MPPERSRCGRALRCALGALAALALSRPAPAAALSLDELSASPPPPSPSAPLDLVVNNGPSQPTRAVLRDGDVLVPVDDLAAAGLQNFLGAREVVEGREHVSLGSLAPALRYDLDERALALRLTAAPELLGRASLDLRSARRPPGLEVGGDASGFLNYSVQHRSAERTTTSGFFEGGASRGGRLLYASGQLREDGEAVRGLTSLTFDDVPGLRRLVLGDRFASSAGLGGGALLGGVALVREYALDPYFVRSPLPRLSGFASTPSVLDVYVNGVLTRQVPLAPGGYDVANLPVTAGAGNVKTVLRDAFGRAEVLDWRYYYTAGLLARGLSDYGYALGFRRREFGAESFAYGRPLLVGRHRVGLSDALTLGGRLDAALDLASAGPSATLGLPFGSLDLEAAASVERGGRLGAAGSAAYSFTSRLVSAGVLVRAMSVRYAHAAQRAADDRAILQTTLFAGAPISSRLGVGVDWAFAALRDAGRTDVLTARADLVVVRDVTLGLSASRTRNAGGEPAYDAFATLAWAFAPMSVADVSMQRGDSGRNAVAGVQKGLPAGTGLGYRARGATGARGDDANALLQAQWDYGRYEVEYDRRAVPGLPARETGTATVAGGAVLVGDRFFLSRPVQEGYGLIRVGVPGVRGFAEGQEIGRTDARGDLLVPTLLPYYGNRLAIADRDVPIAYRIGPTELLAAPSWRGGVVTRFAVTPLRAVEGELVTTRRGADAPPAYGELTVHAAGGPFSSPIGGDGRFFLEGLAPGRHAGEVEWSGGRCLVILDVPETPLVVELGPVRCEPGVLAAAPAAPAPPAVVPAVADMTSPSPPARAGGEGGGEGALARPAIVEARAIATSPTPVTPPRRAQPPPAAKRARPAAAVPAASRAGLGPATSRCPSCSVCFLAVIDRASASRYTLSCARDLALMHPALSRSEAASACIATADYHDLCTECGEVRKARTCPAWPAEPPRRAARSGRAR